MHSRTELTHSYLDSLSHLTSTAYSYIKHPFVSTYNYLGNTLFYYTGDIPTLLWDEQYFISQVLPERADTNNGVGYGYGQKNTKILVGITGASAKEVRWIMDNLDPAARNAFHGFKSYIGQDTLLNLQGKEAGEERFKAKKIFKPSSLIETKKYTQEFVENYCHAWDDKKSLQDHLSEIATNIVAKTFFGVDEYIDSEAIKLLQAMDKLLIENKPTSKKFRQVSDQLHAYNDKVLKENNQNILTNKKYIFETLRQSENEFLPGDDVETFNESKKIITEKELMERLKNVPGILELVVQTNLGRTMEVALECSFSNPDICQDLLEELNSIDWKDPNVDMMEACPKLYRFYLEVLRVASPLAFGVRETSKPTEFQVREKKHSFQDSMKFFVYFRRDHFNPKFFENPETFNPDRFLDKTTNEINKEALKHFFPFSTGTRSCIAADKYVPEVVMNYIATIITQFKFEFKNPIEQVPVNSFYPRCKKPACVSVEPIKPKHTLKMKE